jgi:uncharacterized protein HemY
VVKGVSICRMSNAIVGFSIWYFVVAFIIFLAVYVLLRLLTHRH